MDYEEVMRKIGSQTPAVRHHYITYRLLLQMEDWLEGFSIEDAERRFSVMYNSLRTQGVQDYLNINILATPRTFRLLVPKTHQNALENFGCWLFGKRNPKLPPIFTDSRLVADFGRILESPEAREYLEKSKNPNFDHAFQLAGADESNLVQLLSEAAANVKLVLTRVHHYKDSEDIQQKVETLGIDVQQLLSVLPNIRQKLYSEEKDN